MTDLAPAMGAHGRSDLAPNAVPTSVGWTLGVMGLCGLLILAASFAFLTIDLRSQLRHDAEQEVESTAYLLADHAERLFEVSDVALRAATAAIGDLDWDSIAASQTLFHELGALNAALPYVDDVWLNDPTGALRLTTFLFPAPPSDATDRDSFKAVRQSTDRLYVGERIVGRVTGRPTFLLARRLGNPDGSFRGMVSVTADLAYFNDYWNRIRLPYDARVTLLRAEGLDVLAQHPAPPPGQGFAPVPAPEMRTASAADPNGGDVDFGSDAGAGRVGAYRRLSDVPLYIVVSVSDAALSAAWWSRVAHYGLFAAAGGLAFGTLTLFGFRQARRDQAARVALEAARADLKDANARLETTVVQRTAELRTSERRLRLILESATDYAIIATDLDGLVTNWNVGATNILGWPAPDILGRSVRLIFTPEDQSAGGLEAEMRLALENGRASDEKWHVRQDGSRFFAMGVLLPMRGGERAEGAPIGFIKILRDRTGEFEVEAARRTLNETLERLVLERTAELQAASQRLLDEATSRQRAEEQLRQSQKMESLGRLTGGVAHDFNNLLTIVIGNLDMLRRRVTNTEDARVPRLVAQAIEGAERAAGLTSRLLAFSRRQPLAPESVDVNRLVAGMSDLVRRSLGEDISVEAMLADGLWETHADPNQLENAVLNLAVNARDAMPGGGRLTIATANTHLDAACVGTRADLKVGDYVLIAVGDTGSGMSCDVIAQAFEPFFTTKPVGTGTGLGLSQVYGFVRQSSGYAVIDSALGQGTTVKLYLPRMCGSAAQASHPGPGVTICEG